MIYDKWNSNGQARSAISRAKNDAKCKIYDLALILNVTSALEKNILHMYEREKIRGKLCV